MNHPFYKNKKLLLIYFGIWIMISIIQMLVLNTQYSLTIKQSALDSLIYNLSFAIIGFSLWYLVKFLKSNKPGFMYLFINHLSAGSVLILIWISADKNFLEYIFSDSPMYLSFSEKTTIWRVSFGIMMYGILILIYFAEEYYTDLQEKKINESVLKSAAIEAELKMFKTQINPHFLFNSLNSVSSLTLTDPQKAHEMIIRLSDYFRYSVSHSDIRHTPLKNELDNCKRYLEIEQVRFGSKLKIEFNTDEKSLNRMIPSMILQPLYENAVKYGVYESIGKVIIKTCIKEKADYTEISVENDSKEQLKTRSGEGMGLKNIKERLRLIYNSNNLLSLEQSVDKFKVILKIPFKIEQNEKN